MCYLWLLPCFSERRYSSLNFRFARVPESCGPSSVSLLLWEVVSFAKIWRQVAHTYRASTSLLIRDKSVDTTVRNLFSALSVSRSALSQLWPTHLDATNAPCSFVHLFIFFLFCSLAVTVNPAALSEHWPSNSFCREMLAWGPAVGCDGV